MIAALASLARAGRPGRAPETSLGRRASSSSTRRPTIGPPWPGSPRGTARADQLVYAPILPAEDAAAVVAAARAVLLPVVSEASGLIALDALAAGVPVIASAVGALPEIVGTGGILVEPRDRERLAAAIATMWADDAVRARLVAPLTPRRGGRTAATRARARTWADVADDVRAIYAAVGRPPS